MDKVVSIKPFDQVKITTVSSMSVRVMRLELFKSATLHISLMDANGNGFDSKVIEINGNDYKQWGGDDTFIYDFVAGKLGFSMPDVAPPVLAPVVESPVVDTPVEVVVDTPVEVVVETPVEEAPVSTSE